MSLCVERFIINTLEHNPRIVIVKETNRVVLKCLINQQENLEGLSVCWRRFGLVIRKAYANKVGGTFDFVLESASRNDAGVYQCVVFSQTGNTVIDFGSEISLYIDCMVCNIASFMRT